MSSSGDTIHSQNDVGMAIKHIHKYYHAKMKFGNRIWTCSLPDCNHHMPVHYENTLLGKLSICWNCDKEFRLSEYLMEEEYPICEFCRSGSDKNELHSIMEVLNKK